MPSTSDMEEPFSVGFLERCEHLLIWRLHFFLKENLNFHNQPVISILKNRT